MTKIHVLADETLGGTLREYVEVDRKAEVGDYVFIEEYAEDQISDVVKIIRIDEDGDLVTENCDYYLDNWDIYRVLDPTDIVHIDGSRFRLVDRKAEVGERVLVKMDANADEHNLGKVYEVIGIDGELVDTSGFYDDDSTLNLLQEDYRVLVPVESETAAPKSTDDIIANLARRVAELERQNKAMLDVYERGQKWTHERINGVKDDIETWAQEVEKVRRTAKYAEAKVHKVIRDVDDLAGEVRQVDDKIEMCIDDIVTLDERTADVKPRRCCGCK